MTVPAAYNDSMDALLIVSDLSYAGRVYFDIPMPAIYIFNRSIHPSMGISFATMAEFQRNDKQSSYILSIYTEYTKFLTDTILKLSNLSNIFTLMCCF